MKIHKKSLGLRPHLKNNKGLKINNFLKKYPIKFDMKEDAIDLRTMSNNYKPHGIIPLEDIHQAILVMIKPIHNHQTIPYDPSDGGVMIYPGKGPLLKFGYVDWDDLYLWPVFQRDVSPNHIEKIFPNFDHTAVIVPCAIKITIDNKVHYIIWDGHHTLQVSKLKGYSKFPVWFIDIDLITEDDIKNAGFNISMVDKIKYGCYIAGRNMRWINGVYKRMLQPYDDFMIGYETNDAEIISVMNILKKNNCKPKRHGTIPGAFSQIKSGIECYTLSDKYGNKGKFFDRALSFHRRVWPGAPLTLEVYRPLSYLYHLAEIQGITLDRHFDEELEKLLVEKYGDSESVQSAIKSSCHASVENKTGNGLIPTHDTHRVLFGLINLYNQHVGRLILPPAGYVWKV
jgi:hypothetical protein